jgi:deoxycytidylate deaminase
LFSKVISAENLKEIYSLFEVSTSPFWKTHYTFDKESKQSTKKVTKSFVDLLLINTILPIKFCYAKQNGEAIDETILEIINAIAAEKNSIVDGFSQLKHKPKSALESQAFIQLKTEYCDKNKCLQCAVGNALLTK